MPFAFLSYQTANKISAGQLKDALSGVGINSFLAHEDISVSEEWRTEILKKIEIADIFICLLSKEYFQSPWCVQESGIAAFRKNITIIPLSLDGSIPQGFISSYQSSKVDPNRITVRDFAPGLIKHDFSLGVSIITDLITKSASYRSAEVNFQLIIPHLAKMSDMQVKTLLEQAADNGQVHHASLCANEYLPPLLKSHGHLLTEETRSFLENVCAQYA